MQNHNQNEIVCFTMPKIGEQEADIQDACCWSTDGSQVAIADGASTSLFPGEWANLLVKHFCNYNQDSIESIYQQWEQWLKPIQEEWRKFWFAEIQKKNAPWNVKAIRKENYASATCIGLKFRPLSETGEKTWEAIAVGDSCLFRFNARVNEYTAFPINKSENFKTVTDCFHSLPEQKSSRPKYQQGFYEEGDIFLLATDALAEWILKDLESGSNRCLNLISVATEEQFKTFIGQLRGDNLIKNDDTTLCRIKIVAMVIYLSIIAIAEKPQLWNTYKLDNTERLLFSTVDFQNPDTAQIFNTFSQLSSNISRIADELKKLCKLTDFSKIPSLDAVLTPPVTTWNPGGTTTTTSQPQNPPPQTWNPTATTTTTSQPQNPPPQTWNPTGGTTTTSQPQNPPPQTWNLTGGTTSTSQAQNPQTTTWNPGGSTSSKSQMMSSSPTSLTKQTRKASSPFWVKAIAVVSTLVATGLGGFCYYQYQQINQVRKQLERIRIEKKLLIPNGKKQSLSIYIQDLVNVIKGENSLLYLDVERVIYRLKNNEKSIKSNIAQLQRRVKELEAKNISLTNQNDTLQSRINEFTKYTYVNFCNKTEAKTINAAFVFWDGEGLRSKGWYVVEPEKCREVSVEQNYRGKVYVYGEYNEGSSYWGAGDYSFCIDRKNAFDIPNSDKYSCTGSSQIRVKMSNFSVSTGTNTWNFND